MTRPVIVKFIGDAANLTGTVSKVEGRFGGLKNALLGLGIGTFLVGEFKASTAAAEDANRVGRETEARLKSTGASAWITAEAISGLAAREAEKVGVDDDLIQGGENMLLTFQGVRNEVGQGNDIFNRATKTALDLAAGMHQGRIDAEGLQGANIMLGKALEDPVKGITALTRVGVTFTAQQKDQIRNLVEHNDKLGAQKLILAAVGAQFGGTAEASATATGKMSAKIGNLQEKIGNMLLPVVNRLVTVLGKLADFISRNSSVIVPLLGAIGTIIALVKAWSIAQGILNVVLAANPIGLVILAVAGLAAALVLAWRRSETFRAIVSGAFNAVRAVASAVLGWIRSNWPLLLGILTGPIGTAVVLIIRNFDKLKAIPGQMFDVGRRIVQGIIDGIKSMLGAIADTISGVAGKIRDFLPFSPAKEGPLSGKGSPFLAGRNITRMLSEGMLSGRSGTGVSMGTLLGSPGLLGRPGAGGGPSITVHAHTNADAHEIAREVAWAIRTSGR